ncbi:MAG: nitronate monooxygenase [Sphingomonadaceae bacterium]
MSIPQSIRDQLVLPAVCAPMMMVSGPELVTEACKAGLMAGLPAHNARDADELADWLGQIDGARKTAQDKTGTGGGVLAVNLTASRAAEELEATLALCAQYDVRVIISAMGNPRDLTGRAHARGMLVYHDVTSIQHAEKAISAGVDGLTCIASGGGGHSGQINPFVLIPRIRSMFDGTIILAGAVSSGAGIRAAEILGADLCYFGTRFIATQESRAPAAYKQMLVEGRATDLSFTSDVSGIRANWLNASLMAHGLDPARLPVASAPRNYDHLPADIRPWRDIWSGGQGMELIDDIPTVAELVQRLRTEYALACQHPVFPG